MYNGTRLTTEILTESEEKEIVFNHQNQIDLAPTNPDQPFILRRQQFPVKQTGVWTNDKQVERQTIINFGLYLNKQVFTQ